MIRKMPAMRVMHQVRLRETEYSRGFGGAKRDRTADLLHAMQALSQLSYGPIPLAGFG